MKTHESVAPTYRHLRPLKKPESATFPVYKKLEDILTQVSEHPDRVVAHVLATCAGYAYADAATLTTIMARMGLESNQCRQLSEDVDAMFISSHAYLVQSADGRVVILCFRGTQPLDFINWLTDADVNPETVPVPFADPPVSFAVHGGFYRNVRAVRHEVIHALHRALDGRSVRAKGKAMPQRMEALYLTGHSLGGAMAALMAVMLRTEPAYRPLARTLRAVYTYGQPMIGEPGLAAACDNDEFLHDNVVRYVYGSDVVPQLPPTVSGPFAHFGRELHCGPDGAPTAATRATQQLGNLTGLVAAPMAFLTHQLRLFRNMPFQQSLYDHGPQHYITALTPAGVSSEYGDP
ncbi:lipase family protein [Planosporangium sp. 12N6]|uniref:lipase family protein n=1 Tax=Planosporangium spinosum TaxID=3402278 RepID=UPI003CF05424